MLRFGYFIGFVLLFIPQFIYAKNPDIKYFPGGRVICKHSSWMFADPPCYIQLDTVSPSTSGPEKASGSVQHITDSSRWTESAPNYSPKQETPPHSVRSYEYTLPIHAEPISKAAPSDYSDKEVLEALMKEQINKHNFALGKRRQKDQVLPSADMLPNVDTINITNVHRTLTSITFDAWNDYGPGNGLRPHSNWGTRAIDFIVTRRNLVLNGECLKDRIEGQLYDCEYSNGDGRTLNSTEVSAYFGWDSNWSLPASFSFRNNK